MSSLVLGLTGTNPSGCDGVNKLASVVAGPGQIRYVQGQMVECGNVALEIDCRCGTLQF